MSDLKREDELLLRDLKRMVAEFGLHGLGEDDQLLYSLLTDRYDKFLDEGLKKLRRTPDDDKSGLNGFISFFGGSPSNRAFSKKRPSVLPPTLGTSPVCDKESFVFTSLTGDNTPEALPALTICTANMGGPVIDLCPPVIKSLCPPNAPEEFLGKHWHWVLPNLIIGAIPYAAPTKDTPGHLTELQQQCLRRQCRISCVISCLELDEAVGPEGFATEIDWEAILGVNSFIYLPLPRDHKSPIPESVMADVLECCTQINQRSSAVTSQEFGRALVHFNKKNKVNDIDVSLINDKCPDLDRYTPQSTTPYLERSIAESSMQPLYNCEVMSGTEGLRSGVSEFIVSSSPEPSILSITPTEAAIDGQGPYTADIAGVMKGSADGNTISSVVSGCKLSTEVSELTKGAVSNTNMSRDSSTDTPIIFTGVVVKDDVRKDTMSSCVVPLGIVAGTVVSNGDRSNVNGNGLTATASTKEVQLSSNASEASAREKSMPPLFLGKKRFFNDKKTKKEESNNSFSTSRKETMSPSKKRRVVYIHCKAGFARCYVVAMCYLMSQLGRTFMEADSYIRTVRTDMNPSEEHIRFVKAFEVYVIEQAREAAKRTEIDLQEEERYQRTLADVLSLSPLFRERLLRDMEMLT